MTTQQKIKDITLDDVQNLAEIVYKFNEIIKVINELAPALPEDEECEVVEVVNVD